MTVDKDFNFELDLHCNKCDHTETVLVRERDYDAWSGNGVFIQEAFYYLSSDQRELMISNTCGVCWNKTYAHEMFDNRTAHDAMIDRLNEPSIERNELDHVFADKHNIDIKGDWLLRVQSSPFFKAKEKYGFDISSSVYLSKRQIKTIQEKADSGLTMIHFWLNWGDQMRFDTLALETNSVYSVQSRLLSRCMECGETFAKTLKDGGYLPYDDAEDDDVWIINVSKFNNLKVEV